jgi:hypothetical protein
MSPTEDELRAALHDGEGAGLDPETVLHRARAQGAALRDRRVRVASVAAIAAVVAGIGVTGGVVLSHGSRSHSGDSAGQAAKAAAGNGAAGNGAATNGAGTAEPHSNLALAACPDTLPADTTRGPAPVPGATFFTRPVATITVCAYPSTGGAVIRDGGSAFSVTLSGADATALSSSIEHAPTKLDPRPCPLYLNASARTLLMVPIATDGTPLPDVTTTALQNPCNAPITNGQTIRYNWTPPASLTSFLARLGQLTATASPSHS